MENNELKIDINDLEHFEVKELELDLSGDDNTGMLQLEGGNGIVAISKKEIQEIRADFEEDEETFCRSILLVGSKIITTHKYGDPIEVEITLDETVLNRGINGKIINVDIEGMELN